jgi:hypothetical protein
MNTIPLFEYDNFFLFLQIVVSLVGLILTLKIHQLLNHGNYWWLMSVGYIFFIIASIMRFFVPHAQEWYGEWNVLYIPLAIRLAFVISTWRIYIVARNEHQEKIEANGKVNLVLDRLREFTNRTTDVCPFWKPGHGCTNPDNPKNKDKSWITTNQ